MAADNSAINTRHVSQWESKIFVFVKIRYIRDVEVFEKKVFEELIANDFVIICKWIFDNYDNVLMVQ